LEEKKKLYRKRKMITLYNNFIELINDNPLTAEEIKNQLNISDHTFNLILSYMYSRNKITLINNKYHLKNVGSK
jgi:response regulator of citrate/malate metabolism